MIEALLLLLLCGVFVHVWRDGMDTGGGVALGGRVRRICRCCRSLIHACGPNP